MNARISRKRILVIAVVAVALVATVTTVLVFTKSGKCRGNILFLDAKNSN